MSGFLKHKSLPLLGLLFSFFILSGLSCKGQGLTVGPPPAVTLEMWGVFDARSDWQPIIDAYVAQHPNVSINYRSLRYDEYESTLLNALAEDRGPDIFAVHDSWMHGYQPKLEPLPAELTVPIQVVKGNIKKEVLTEQRTSKSLTLNQLKNQFIDAVYDEAVLDNKIYGLPMAVDTLALYYNKDLLRNAGIVSPPLTWVEFQEQVVKLTRQNDRGTIIQSGAGIGAANNVQRSPDILSLLMMQNGAQMTDGRGNVVFNITPEGFQRGQIPAADALVFYTDFANPAKQVYTWNSQLSESLDSFMSGRVAFHFDYSFARENIEAQAPRLNFDVAPMPQILGNAPVNYANYWFQSVSTKSKNKNYAWDFIQFATGEEQVQKYLNATRKPTARRNLIAGQQEDLELAPFASQLVSARTWYRGKDFNATYSIFKDMINEMLAGTEDAATILNRAARRVNQTL